MMVLAWDTTRLGAPRGAGEKVRTLRLNGPPLNGTRKAKMSRPLRALGESRVSARWVGG